MISVFYIKALTVTYVTSFPLAAGIHHQCLRQLSRTATSIPFYKSPFFLRTQNKLHFYLEWNGFICKTFIPAEHSLPFMNINLAKGNHTTPSQISSLADALNEAEEAVSTNDAKAPITFIQEGKKIFGFTWMRAPSILHTGQLCFCANTDDARKINFMFEVMTRIYGPEVRRINNCDKVIPIFRNFHQRTDLERFLVTVPQTNTSIIEMMDMMRMQPFFSSATDKYGYTVSPRQEVVDDKPRAVLSKRSSEDIFAVFPQRSSDDILELSQKSSEDMSKYFCFCQDVPLLSEPPTLDLLSPFDL